MIYKNNLFGTQGSQYNTKRLIEKRVLFKSPLFSYFPVQIEKPILCYLCNGKKEKRETFVLKKKKKIREGSDDGFCISKRRVWPPKFSFRFKAPSALPFDGTLSLFTSHNGRCSSIFTMVSRIDYFLVLIFVKWTIFETLDNFFLIWPLSLGLVARPCQLKRAPARLEQA